MVLGRQPLADRRRHELIVARRDDEERTTHARGIDRDRA